MWVTFNFSITFQTEERMVFQLGTLSVSPSGLFSRALGWEPCDNGVFFRVEWLWEKLPLLFRHFLFFSYKWERDWWRQQQKKNNYRQWESTTTQTLHGLIILGRGLETSLFRLIHLWGDIPPDTGRKTVTLDMGWHAEPLLTVPTQHDAPKLKQERKLLILICLTAGAGTMIFHISWGEKRGAVTCFFFFVAVANLPQMHFCKWHMMRYCYVTLLLIRCHPHWAHTWQTSLPTSLLN